MRTRLSRSRWAALLAAFGLLATALYLVTAGAAVGPCLGGPGPEQDELRRQCARQWFESRPLWEKLFHTPFMAVAVFVAVVLATAWLTRVRGPRENQAG